MKDIVITTGTAGSVLALARSIKKKVKCRVFVLCANLETFQIIEPSKYITKVILISDKTEDIYINDIKIWRNNTIFESKPILYFASDLSCFYVDKHRNWFEQNFDLCMPDSFIIQTYTQKGIAEKSAEKSGLKVPKTQVINTEDDIDQVLTNFSFPVILKPRAVYLRNNINFKIKVFENKEKFKAFTQVLINKKNTLLCQEFIIGGNDSSYFYLFYRAKNGDIIDNMGKKILQTSVRGGIMAKGKTEYNYELSKLCRSFLNKIDYKGIGGIEFKKHNGIYYFIEMSVRLEGFFKIAEASGSPLSLTSYCDFTKQTNEYKNLINSKQKDGVIYVDELSTLVARIYSKNFLSLLFDLMSICFNKKVILNMYSKDDKKPFWSMFKSVIVK